MANDRVTAAIDNLIDALSELKDAWIEQQQNAEAESELISLKEELASGSESESEPVPESAPEPEPATVSEPVPEPAPVSEPAPEPAPVSEPAPKPAPATETAGKPGSGRVCPACGAPLNPDSRFCMQCGTRAQADPVPASQPVSAPQPQMISMYCIHCGAELMPGDRYCVSCGKPV